MNNPGEKVSSVFDHKQIDEGMPFNPRWRARMDWREEGAFHNPYPTYTPEYDAYEYEAWIISMDHDNPARP